MEKSTETVTEKTASTISELVWGRPAEEAGRLAKELRTYNLLDSLGVKYQRIDHEAIATIHGCEGIDQILGVEICKNLFLCNRQKTDFYLLMMPGEKQFKTKDLSHQLGVARLSFADPAYMEEFLDITPGSVSVLGLMNDRDRRVRLLVDEDVLKEPYLACHPCINTSSLKFTMEDFRQKIIPAMGHEMTVVTL